MCGSRGANYDRYPECWQNGKPAPNLETFAKEITGLDGEMNGFNDSMSSKNISKTRVLDGFGVFGRDGKEHLS